MTDAPYLVQLTARLRDALRSADDGLTRAASRFILSRQDDSGGFRGPGGPGDLYYTGFALRALAATDAMGDQTAAAASAKRFLGGCKVGNIIDAVSYLSGLWTLAWPGEPAVPNADKLLDLLAAHRTDDGGYGKTANASAGSTYHTFLAGLCHELLRAELPQPQRVGEFVLTRRRDDGGFAELAQMPHSSINPTAAGAALAVATGVADLSVLSGVAGFLIGAQHKSGGWPASPRVEAADLLSTFTATLTLADFDALGEVNLTTARRFVQACRASNGGFAAAPGMSDGDVEYTFYGLGCLAAISG